ncbi:glycoside hydrolase family 3 N-terminal domain-containing protein [Algibacter lectus]|uniref:glycoside hydrolase family 3 N-terminal domain-containing protein n=1 Tax=Algibacter lectus TaxID=221126 RepID=UPI001E5A074C|nr:glycoside hydrolase family 3 N-terminal domain-containing protein [Algibacter lectus]
MKTKCNILLVFLVFSNGGSSQEKRHAYKDVTLSIEERVENLLSVMSIEEKVAQMRIFHANIGVRANSKGGLELSDKVISKLGIGIGGIKNPGESLSPLEAAKLNNELQEYIIKNNRWGIPGLFVTESYNGVDAEGCTVFGRPIASAASFNPELVQRVWDVVGREARLRGMHMCHSPEADLVRDPRFGRMSEAFGEDTYLTTQMVVSAVKGVQGDYVGLGNGTHIGAVVKHFAGYGQVLGGTNFAAVEISPRTLEDEIYPSFEAAVKEAEALGVMASHADLNGIASHGNKALLTGVLRDRWGFDGYVVSDANDVARLFSFMKVAESKEDAAILGLEAGIDVDLYSEDAYALLPEILKTKPELMTLIDRSAGRVLRTKFILGLFENPYIDTKLVASNVRSESSLNLAQESDLESIILLKNDASLLPLKKSGLKKIALLGPLVEAGTKVAFEEVVGSEVSIVANQGFHLTNENRSTPKLLPRNDLAIEELLEIAKTSDVVVLFLGGDRFTSKEAFFGSALGDRATIEPVGSQDELLERVKLLGKPIVVVLKHRRTLAINKISELADAVLDGWDLSEKGDNSFAKVIFGEVSPSGKLPVTVPRSIGQLPFHYSGKEINNKKEYLFMEKGPLYPFGFGLSYANFEYANLKLSSEVITPETEIEVRVDVKNTSAILAKEVVQLYIKDEVGSVMRPNKELKAFEKVLIKGGETKTVRFVITPKMLEFTGVHIEKVLEKGAYTIMVGTSSSQGVTGKFELNK